MDRRHLKQTTALIAQIDQKGTLNSGPARADLLVNRIEEYIESVGAEATSTDSIPVEEMDEFEREEDRLLQQHWTQLQPVKAKLTDRRHMAAVLGGRTGIDEKAALKQAFSNAVQQAVGVIVDAETVVKDDQIITDQVLTASNAIITQYEPVGSPKSQDGLVTVKIRADVQRKQLTERLAAANVVSTAVEGKDVFAQVVTDLQREHDTTAIVRRLFQDFPANVWKAEPTAQPRVISKTDTEATIGVTVEISCDQTKYAQWLKTVTPFLSRLATKSEERRLNPKDAGFVSLDQLVAHLGDISGYDSEFIADGGQPEKFKDFPKTALHTSYWVSKSFEIDPKVELKTSILAMIDRNGSTHYTVCEIDQPTRNEALRATFAVNILDVSLKDATGAEIDGQTKVLGNGAFLDHNLKSRMDLDNREVTADWVPNEYNVKGDTGGIVLSPYIVEGGALLSAAEVELQFTLPLDRLKELKSVEAKLSSKNNVPARK